jgi:hypothetical protein
VGYFNRNKYKAVKVSHSGYYFASKGEAALFDILRLRELSKEITDLKCQVSVYLTKSRIQYIADFSHNENGETVYDEYKGFETDVWRIKRRLWKNYGPGVLRVYKKRGPSVVLHEEIIPEEDNDVS